MSDGVAGSGPEGGGIGEQTPKGATEQMRGFLESGGRVKREAAADVLKMVEAKARRGILEDQRRIIGKLKEQPEPPRRSFRMTRPHSADARSPLVEASTQHTGLDFLIDELDMEVTACEARMVNKQDADDAYRQAAETFEHHILQEYQHEERIVQKLIHNANLLQAVIHAKSDLNRLAPLPPQPPIES